jgi:hypothetical protein
MQIKASKQMFSEMRKHAGSEAKLISAAPSARGRSSIVIENEPEAAVEIDTIVSSAPEGEDKTAVPPHEIDYEESHIGGAGCGPNGADIDEKSVF